MEDEWEILNEIEGGGGGDRPSPTEAPKVLVEDSQVVEMPLGPDQAPLESEDEGDDDPGALDASGQPRKVWKKKGQKRQTKRTNMKPVLHKPKKASELEAEDVEEDGGDGGEGEVVDDTQLADGVDGDGEDVDAAVVGKGKKTAKPSVKQPSPKKKKMISAQSHANFRALKIKNKNSKGKGGGGGRKFGRR